MERITSTKNRGQSSALPDVPIKRGEDALTRAKESQVAVSPSRLKSQQHNNANMMHQRTTATFVPYYWEAYNEIVEPRRFDHYLLRKWARDLGPLGFLIVKVLRDRCYHNPQTGVLRDECEIDMDELAHHIGVHRSTIFREFNRNQALSQFVRRVEQFRMVNGHPEQTKNLYQVCMDDPVHPNDLEEYDLLRAKKESERMAAVEQLRQDAAADGSRPKKRLQRADKVITVESQIATQQPSATQLESQIATPNTVSQFATPDTTCLEARSATPIKDDLPSGSLYTKDSLTPAAGDSPQHKCCPPEGEAERDALDPLDAVWQQALVILSEQVNIPTFEAHLRPLRPVRQDGDTFALAAPSAFTLEWIVKRHEGHIREALSVALGRAVTVEIVLENK